MLAQGGKLVNFEEEKRRRTADIYLPGDVPARGRSTIIPMDFYSQGRYLSYEGENTSMGEEITRIKHTLKKGRPIEGRVMPRFTGGTYLRQQSKARIMGKLRMIPSNHIPGGGVAPIAIRNLPQQPQYFPELAGFGQEPVGSMNAIGTVAPERGWWGDLNSLLSQAGTVVMGTQAAKAEASIAASKAAIAASQAATAQATIQETIWRYLPLIMAVGGGTVLLYFYMQKRRKRG